MAHGTTFERWWRKLGFAAQPRSRTATGREIVYRVFGGPRNLPGGRFVTPARPGSVVAAERGLHIGEHGNQMRGVATFRLLPGTRFWEGPIAHRPGDLAEPGRIQYFVPRGAGDMVLVRDVEPLEQDATVGRGSRETH